MKLVKCDLMEIDGGYYKPTKNQRILKEFIDSGMECAKLEGWTNKTASSCASSLSASVRRFGFNNIAVVCRQM